SQVEAWDRVAVAEVAALGPVDDRKELHADLPQPCADVVAGARHVLLGPAPWPHVLWVELGDSQPVLERQALVVGDPRAALLGRVDHEHAPESLPCQSTDLLGAATVEQEHGVSATQQLERAHQAGQPGAHDDHIGLSITHRASSRSGRIWVHRMQAPSEAITALALLTRA